MTAKQLLTELSKERYDAKGLSVGYYYKDSDVFLELQEVSKDGDRVVLTFDEYYPDPVIDEPEDEPVPVEPWTDADSDGK